MIQKLNLKSVFSIVVLCLIVSCQNKHSEFVKMNQIQVIGSHNSYKKQIQPEVMKIIADIDSSWASTLDYHHISLTDQLNLGLRNLELDVVNDPKGGRFKKPKANDILKKEGVTPLPYDTLHEMDQPGFKIMHIPDLDFRTWNYTLRSALKELKTWSLKHPKHLPVVITMNAKTGKPAKDDFTQILPFTEESFDSLDNEILSSLGKNQIICPDDIRGDFKSLNKAVLTKGWPDLDSVRGKFLFVLDERGKKRELYIKNHPSLMNRVMFVRTAPGTPESAFLIINDPVASLDSIKKLVKMGYMVRTRADADTKEARLNDYSRLKAAMLSGAQIITTDYYIDKINNYGNSYHVCFSKDSMIRYNPVLLNDINNRMKRLE